MFLPRELHAFLLQYAINQNVSYWNILRDACYALAESKGFKHEHRFKKVGIAKGTICVICGRDVT